MVRDMIEGMAQAILLLVGDEIVIMNLRVSLKGWSRERSLGPFVLLDPSRLHREALCDHHVAGGTVREERRLLPAKPNLISLLLRDSYAKSLMPSRSEA